MSHRFEVMMNFLYLVGSVFFNGATVLYIPEVSSRLGSETAGRYGSGGFIIGSALFIFACFLNGAHTGDAFSGGSKDARLAKVSVLATTNATMFGSCLFLVGSVLYMPDLGCAEETAVYGTYCYLWGSVAFVVEERGRTRRLRDPPLSVQELLHASTAARVHSGGDAAHRAKLCRLLVVRVAHRGDTVTVAGASTYERRGGPTGPRCRDAKSPL